MAEVGPRSTGGCHDPMRSRKWGQNRRYSNSSDRQQYRGQHFLATTILHVIFRLPHVIARAENYTHARVLARVGPTRSSFPKGIWARRLATLLIHPWMSRSFKFQVHLPREIKPVSEMIGKTIEELDFRIHYSSVILSISRGGERFVPKKDTVIQENDMILVAGQKEDLEKWVDEKE